MNFNDGLCPGGRTPRLYLARGGEVRKFEGGNIPGFCAIQARRFEKNGKWSNTDYELLLAPGVRALHFLSPLHGTWGDELPSWAAVAEQLALPVDVAQNIVRGEYPRTAERLDKMEAFASEIEAIGMTTETVVISFGSPTNRAIRDGYWSKPKTGRTTDGRDVIIQPGPGQYRPDWSRPVVVAPEGAKVISAKSRPGMHGGTWSIEVSVPLPEQPQEEGVRCE